MLEVNYQDLPIKTRIRRFRTPKDKYYGRLLTYRFYCIDLYDSKKNDWVRVGTKTSKKAAQEYARWIRAYYTPD